MSEIKLGKRWTTYMGVLIRVLSKSDGDVAEFGAGIYSTPLLHWICKDMERELITYEDSTFFFNHARAYQSRNHRVIKVGSWDDIDSKKHRGVIFIDHHSAQRRAIDAIRFKNSADYIVIHDTNETRYYKDVWRHFKYCYHWKACVPWTSVVSNFKDLWQT